MDRSYRILRFSYLHFQSSVASDIFPDSGMYQKYVDAFLGDKIYNCAGFSKALKKLGHDPIDVFYDLEWLQKKWATENGCVYSEKSWFEEISFAQILKYRPDVIFFQQNTGFSRFCRFVVSWHSRFGQAISKKRFAASVILSLLRRDYIR